MKANEGFLFIIIFLVFHLTVLGQENSKSNEKWDSLKYYNALDFDIIGKFHSENNYNRLPQKYKTVVRPEVWDLSQNAAGISIRFRSDASYIKIKWRNIMESYLPHMAPTGVKGLDLYALVGGEWQFVQTARPNGKQTDYILLDYEEPIEREYLLNLPLYDGVESLFIGVNEGAKILKPESQSLTNQKPIVYYGSSIAQGGCASRPGMAFTNILSRKLGIPFINFGFSGEGKFEASVGEAMLEIDAAIYVIDCNPNTDIQLIYDQAMKLVNQLKKSKPEIPVLLVENFVYANAAFKPKHPIKSGNITREMSMDKQLELTKAYNALIKSGIKEIYYKNGNNLIGMDHEATVDGVHPTDLGMMRIADNLYPVIEEILKRKNTVGSE